MTLETWQRLSPQRRVRLDAAVHCYLRRQARRINPEGYFDNARRWHPSETEKQACCDLICEHGRADRYSLKKHCRSMEHIAHLFDVDLRFLCRRVKFMIGFLQELREGYRRTSCFLYEQMARQHEIGTPSLHDIPGVVTLKPPAKLPFNRDLTQAEEDDLDKLLKGMEGSIEQEQLTLF